MPPPEPSTALVSAPPCVSAGDPQTWFKEEVHVHDGQLRAYLKSRYPSVGDVDDVVQESYLKIWQAKAKHEIHSAKAFLFRIATNLVLNGFKQKKPESLEALGDFAPERVLDEKPGVAELASDREKVMILADAILALPKGCREIVLLKRFEGLSHKEIAAKLGRSVRTIESQDMIGVRKLEAYLRSRGIFDSFR